ncbi:MAG TPA: AgmX/PglI C-terminal domain-containing protein [Polyangia bacterium]|jgi:hypothetical protein
MRAAAGPLVALCLLLTGCAASLAEVSAGRVGCDPTEIQIVDDRVGWGSQTWKVNCRGRWFQCSGTPQRVIAYGPNTGAISGYAGANVSCSAMIDEAPAAAAPARAPGAADDPPGLGQVVRTKLGPGDVMLKLRFKAGDFRFVATATPARDRDHLVLTVQPPSALDGKGCVLRIMIDGELVHSLAPATAADDPRRERHAHLVPLAVFAQIGPGHRVLGRYCEEEWYLGPKTLARVRELMIRVWEELRWLDDPTARPPASLPAAAAPAPVASPRSVKTRLEPAEVQEGMRAVKGRVQACYQQHQAAGVVQVALTIEPSGRVSHAAVTGSFANTRTGDCVAAAVRAATFVPYVGAPLRISYPFVLK